MSIEDKIIGIVCELLDSDPREVGPETRLMKDLYADSLVLVELSVNLEDSFGVPLPEKMYWGSDLTVGEIIDFYASETGKDQ